MKLSLLVVAAVTVATCYALPVPKEGEVFTVYPVNSALAQNTTDPSVEAKPDQTNAPVPVNVPSAPVAVSEKSVENKPELLKTVPVEGKPVEAPVKEESVKAVPNPTAEVKSTLLKQAGVPNPTAEVKSAPLKEAEAEAKPAQASAPVGEVQEKDEDVVDDVELADGTLVLIEEPEEVSEVIEPELVAGVIEPMLVSGVVEAKLVSGVIEPKVTGGVVETKPVAAEPKPAEAKKEAVPVVKSAEPEKPKADAVSPAQENAPKSVEPVQVEKKLDAVVEAAKDKPVQPEVKLASVDNKPEKLTEQPKEEVKSEPTQLRSAVNEQLPAVTTAASQPEQKEAVKSVNEVPAAKVEDKKPVEEKPADAKVVAVPEVKAAAAALEPNQPAVPANDPQPQTEGKIEEKPTKVRAVPIVEGLKVAQPVEAEPAITKIHVSVIQEEFPVRAESVAAKEPVPVAPVVVSEEKKLAEPVPVSVSAVKNDDVSGTKPAPAAVDAPVVKSLAAAAEKPSEVKAEVVSDKPADVKSVEPAVKSDAEAKPVEPKKDEPSVKAVPVPATTVVASVNAEDVTTVVAVTEKPEQVATVQAVPVTEKSPQEQPTSVAVDVKPALKSVEQLAKAADAGSSQPATTTKSAETVKESTKDQSNGDSTTVTASTEADSTTVTSVTEPEPVPTPAKQKGKKQAPAELKGYRQRLKQQEAQTKKQANSSE
ncbi:proteoglycan 4-like [Anopheles ziemanni]|uniref:proteoglycan 4-like n=1 Tax=Anopheles coustani TaxID=139045 RepID=UPI002657F3F3|nr:proteoglycan 4-like [Anopheles coustani]XP_058166508.1 proteoglycan 4-like [Anopheles ziemanni]